MILPPAEGCLSETSASGEKAPAARVEDMPWSKGAVVVMEGRGPGVEARE
jgi:hypothetical protein